MGEAFLIGKGAPFALGQGSEWPAICRLLTAPLPPLRSCLLDLAAGQQQQQQAGGELGAGAKGGLCIGSCRSPNGALCLRSDLAFLLGKCCVFMMHRYNHPIRTLFG